MWIEDEEPFDIDFDRIETETDDAILFVVEDDPFAPETFWIPKSIADVDHENNTVSVPMWFAIKEGFA
jgi:hypothetical protein